MKVTTAAALALLALAGSGCSAHRLDQAEAKQLLVAYSDSLAKVSHTQALLTDSDPIIHYWVRPAIAGSCEAVLGGAIPDSTPGVIPYRLLKRHDAAQLENGALPEGPACQVKPLAGDSTWNYAHLAQLQHVGIPRARRAVGDVAAVTIAKDGQSATATFAWEATPTPFGAKVQGEPTITGELSGSGSATLKRDKEGNWRVEELKF